MGFRVVVTRGDDWVKIAELAAANPRLSIFHEDTSELECESADQATLDTAFNDYKADQTNIDAKTRENEVTARREQEKRVYDELRLHRAMISTLLAELNILRNQFNATTRQLAGATNTAFTDVTVDQARTEIRSAIDNL